MPATARRNQISKADHATPSPVTPVCCEAEELMSDLQEIAEKYANECSERPEIDACILVIHLDHTEHGVPDAMIAHELIGQAIHQQMESIGNIHEYAFKLYHGLFYFLNHYDYQLSDGTWTARPESRHEAVPV